LLIGSESKKEGMTFKNFFSASARRTVLRKKGRADGRPTAAHFNRFVRQPFHERSFAHELSGETKHRAYNAFDSNAVRNSLRNQHRRANGAHLTSLDVLRQINAENQGRKRVASPNRKYLPIR
jgi:hypothetical protein